MVKGQIVFAKAYGHNSDRNNRKITKCIVVSVGPKYFKIKEFEIDKIFDAFERMKFSQEDMCDVTNYSSEYRVYLSEKEMQDEIDRPSVKLKIDVHLSALTTDELREALEILTKKFM